MKSTCLPDEIIIAASEVDSKKEDELYKILKPLCNNIELIISGISTIGYSGANRNRGATCVKNNILIFMDADDFIHPQKIEIVKKMF